MLLRTKKGINFYELPWLQCMLCILYHWILVIPRYGRNGLGSIRRLGLWKRKSFVQDHVTSEWQGLGLCIGSQMWRLMPIHNQWHWESIAPFSDLHGIFYNLSEFITLHYIFSLPLHCELLWKQEVFRLSRLPGTQYALFLPCFCVDTAILRLICIELGGPFLICDEWGIKILFVDLKKKRLIVLEVILWSKYDCFWKSNEPLKTTIAFVK